MTIASHGSHRLNIPGGPQVADTEDFATLATELDAAQDLNQVLAQVLEFAVARTNCASATVHLPPAGLQLATKMTSHRRLTAVPTDSSQPHEVAPGLIVDLTDGRSTVGMIAFYPAQPDGFTTADITTAYLIALHASLAIAAIRTVQNLSPRSTPTP